MSMLKSVTKISCGEGKTKQKVGYEMDLNKIVARYKRTGQLNMPENRRILEYADVSKIGTYQECLNKVAEVEMIFHEIPSEIRDRFENSPLKYMQFVETLADNPENQKIAIELGIMEKPVEKPVEDKAKQEGEKK